MEPNRFAFRDFRLEEDTFLPPQEFCKNCTVVRDEQIRCRVWTCEGHYKELAPGRSELIHPDPPEDEELVDWAGSDSDDEGWQPPPPPPTGPASSSRGEPAAELDQPGELDLEDGDEVTAEETRQML